MYSKSSLAYLSALAAVAQALPLNINLGAYSPAVVVGDGALTFEGGEAPAQVPEGAAAVVIPQAATPPQIDVAPVAEAPAPAVQATGTPFLADEASIPLDGMGKIKAIEPRQLTKRQAGFDRALQFAEVALTRGPRVELGTGNGGAGVGIIVDNNAATNAAPAPAAGE